MKKYSEIRSKKSAKLKLAVLSAAMKLIRDKSFKDLHIDQLCKEVNISKVTLFKYFPQKEDILLYYMRVWTLHCAVELRSNGKKGVSGIYYIIDKLSDTFEKYPGILLSFVGHLANNQIIQKPFTVREEERKMLHPELDDIGAIEIRSLEQMLETFLLEAIFNKEITRSSNTQELTHQVISVIYGSIITAHIHRMSPSKLYFRKNVGALLNGLK